MSGTIGSGTIGTGTIGGRGSSVAPDVGGETPLPGGAAVLAPPSLGALLTSHPTVRLKALDGTWEEVGRDRWAGVVPVLGPISSNGAGDDIASFVLHRDPALPHPDLLPYTPCEIEEAGSIIWEGEVWETPGSDEGGGQVTVQGRGWQYHMDHDVLERSWIHSRLSDWYDPRSRPTTALQHWKANGTVNSDGGAITLSFAEREFIINGSHLGVSLDLRKTDAKAVVVDMEAALDAGFTIYARGHDYEDPQSGTYEQAGINAPGEGARIVVGFNTYHRYVSVFLYYSGPTTQITTGGDRSLKIKGIRVARDPSYYGGAQFQSVLRAHTVLKDLRPELTPELSSDESLIATTSLSLPDFHADSPRTFREYGDAVNAFHRYRLAVVRERRPFFQPQASSPKWVCGSWGTRNFENASLNAGEDVYNRVFGVATSPAGDELRIERWTGQLPGQPGDRISTPGFANPSFTTDAAGWSGATRDTAVYDTAPASGAISTGVVAYQFAQTGPWKKGVAYRLGIRLRPVFASSVAIVVFGVTSPSADDSQSWKTLTGPGTWDTSYNVWIPAADRAASVVRVGVYFFTTNYFGSGWVPSVGWIDSINVETVKPTVLDRRGRVRTKTLQVGSSMDVSTLTVVCDAFLSSHLKTPLRGQGTIYPGDLRDYLSGAPVHPRELAAADPGQLIHFSNMIDPDTGAIGRDGQVANVTYDPSSQGASVAIDSTRDNMEQLLNRYALITGQA